MKKQLVGLALGESIGCTVEEGFPLLKKHGIESTFTSVSTPEQLDTWASMAASYGIDYSSLHAPFKHAAKMWDDSLEGEDAERELHDSIDACAGIQVPILVVHPFIGFYDHTPTETGLARYRRLAEYAEKKSVRMALENVEGEAHLEYLMKGLSDFDSVGFCLDTGHELCYNRGRDMLEAYGDRLCYLHINSNMGVTSPSGEIGWRDDSHMLPFDGVADMEFLAKRLSNLNYQGVLMMELVKGNRPDRTTNDIYNHLTADEYIGEAAARIKKLRDMIR